MENKRILLVDDEASIRLTFKRELQHNYRITLASEYKEALALLMDNRFDMLITDLVMPGLNGGELVKQVKRHNPEMSVIIITGYGEIDAVIETMRGRRRLSPEALRY